MSLLDASMGMLAHATHTKGTSGVIRKEVDDFLVEEIVSDQLMGALAELSDETHRYPILQMEKEGIDTISAIRLIERRLGGRTGYLGLKDAKARTKQLIFFSPRRRAQLQPDHLVRENIHLRLLGFATRRPNRSDLVGNRFRIRIREVHAPLHDVENAVQESARLLRERRMPNFYGYQRFGAGSVPTHHIGRAIVQGRMDGAVELLISQRHDRPRRIRGSMHWEQIMEKHLSKAKGDYVGALRRLPISLRRLFVNAYQAYLFNRTISEAITNGLDMGCIEVGDFTMDQACNPSDWEVRVADSKRLGATPLIPLVGYGYRGGGGRFSKILTSILRHEEIELKHFYVKSMAEVSVEGGFRSAAIPQGSLSWQFLDAYSSLTLEMTLPRGSYATVILREIMKPEDPALSGF